MATTRELLDTIKGCESVGLHGEAVCGRESYSDAFVFRTVATIRKQGQETKKEIVVHGRVSNGHSDDKKTCKSTAGRTFEVYSGVYRPERGFWWLCAGALSLKDVLAVLPGGAEVTFHVYLDAGTNEILVDRCLHADQLYLIAKYLHRGKPVERRFLLDTSIGSHNIARFGYASQR